MKLSYQKKSALSALFILFIWEINLIFAAQKQTITLFGILAILFILVQIYDLSFKSKFKKRLNYLLDLKFWKNNFPYLILPLFLFVSTAGFVKIIPNILLQQLILMLSLIATYLIILYTHNTFSKKLKNGHEQTIAFAVVKIYTAFLSFAVSYDLMLQGRISLLICAFYCFSITIVLFYQAFQKIKLGKLLLAAFLSFWAVYLNKYLGLTSLTGASLLTILFYISQSLWGHKYPSRKEALYRLEYLLLGLLALLIILMNNTGQIL